VAAVRAAVRGTARYWLPGGGALAHESPERTVIREVREELGRSVRALSRLGRAVQYFYAGDRKTWYKMTAVFVCARFDAEPVSGGEHELCWIDPARDRERFFHACHAWAACLWRGQRWKGLDRCQSQGRSRSAGQLHDSPAAANRSTFRPGVTRCPASNARSGSSQRSPSFSPFGPPPP
jgi:ADP-ribose pyrophosphatase YjhB (NUDIX family)